LPPTEDLQFLPRAAPTPGGYQCSSEVEEGCPPVPPSELLEMGSGAEGNGIGPIGDTVLSSGGNP